MIFCVPRCTKALEEYRGESEGKMPLEVFTPPERSVQAVMGPKGGAGPALPMEGGDGDGVDFVLTLGGDGLLMYSNTLFRVSKAVRRELESRGFRVELMHATDEPERL